MKRVIFASMLAAVVGCAGTRAPKAPATASAPVSAPLVAKLCGDWVLTSQGLWCQRPLSADEQTHRSVAYRLWYRDSLVERMERINGRGFPEPDDNGCSERRYRFESGLLAEVAGYRRDGSVCDRSLFSERASRVRFVDAWGRPDFDTDRAYTGALYERDAHGVVIRMRPLASDGSPSRIQGAAEVRYEHDAQHFETRACYFDERGKPTLNQNGVHCYAHERDAWGNDLRQTAWDTDGKPTLGSERVHAWVSHFDRYGNRTKQTQLGVDGNSRPSLFVRCATALYYYDDRGYRTGMDCRDANEQLSEFEQGNSRWVSTADARGRPREVRFFDRHGSPFTSSVGYARVEMERNELGYITEHRYFLADGTPGQKEEGAAVVRHELDARNLEVKRSYFDGRGEAQSVRGCSAQVYTYDEHRDMVRQACLDGAGNPSLNRDKVSITTWSFDAQGQIAEVRFLDPNGNLADNRSGYARKVLTHDARGADRATQHFKADGGLVPLRRFSVLWVHPPYSDGFWPAPSRAEAVETIERARRELLAGLPWASALVRYGDEKVSPVELGDTGYLNLETIYPVAREAVEGLEVGQYSRVVEMPYGLALYLRTE